MSLPSLQSKKWGARFIILIPLAFLLFFFVVPVFIMLLYSFWELDDNYKLNAVWNMNQYKDIFKNDVYMKLLYRSIKLAFFNTMATFLIAYPLAYYIAKVAKKEWRYVLLFLTILPSWTSLLIRAYSWMLVLGEKGIFNYFLIELNILSEPLSLIFTSKTVLIGLIHIYLPYMVLPLYSSLEKIDGSLIEAAQSLGASKLKVFTNIIFRLSLPGVVSGCIIVFVPSIGEYVIPMLLGGNQGMMYSNAISRQFMILNWPLGAALAFILFVLILIVFIVYSKFMKIEELWSGL